MELVHFTLTFALGILVAGLVARLERTRGRVERIVAEVHALREECRRGLRRIGEETPASGVRIANAELRRTVEVLIEEKLDRALANTLKQALDEHCRALGKYIEDEVVPRAVLRCAVPAA